MQEIWAKGWWLQVALTYTKLRTDVAGSLRHWHGTITFDNSYPTGGEAVTASSVGMNTVLYAIPTPNTAMSRLTAWDGTNKKLLLFTALSTEAGNASDQSTITIPCTFVGY